MPVKGQSIRIISGEWRGRRLPVIDAEGLRPTKDAVRETLFNWLAPYLPKSKCLDLYAGTGALGFEAASRYASEVVFVEKNRDVAKQIDGNFKLLGSSNTRLVNSSAEQFLNGELASFDVVFLDPPFQLDDIEQVLERLVVQGFVHEESVIYVEQAREKGLPKLPANWLYHREKKMGQVVYGLAKFSD